MRWIVLWLFFILRHMPLYAQNDGDCGDWSSMKDVNDITDEDDYNILEVTDFPFTANDVKVSMCNGIEIVRHEVNENKLLFITQNMRNWEETMPNQDSLAVICFNVAFSNEECSGKTVNMKIQDTNNYKPRFVDEQEVDKPVFEIILPMPFPAEFPLDSFGSIIMAKDEDYTDTKLTFTIESNKFLDIKYVGTTGELKKVHTASLISKSPLDFDEMQFNIKVEDKDKKIDLGKIVIKKNPKVSLVYPEFDKSYYMGKYDRDGMSEMIDEITLKNAKTIILEGAYAQYFEAFIVDDKVTIKPQKPLTETNDQNVIFTIKATNNEGYSDEATIIIEPIVTDLPKFSESYYLGSLDIESKELKHDPILVEADNDAKIDINDEDLKQIFTVALTGQEVHITLSQNANIEEIKDTDIVLPLQITNSNGGAATTIVVFEVIRKTVEPISFSKTNYQGELNVDTNVIKLEAEIKIVKGEADAVKILEQEYESQFKVTIEPNTKIVNIELKEKLNNVEQPGLILTLEVSNMKGQSSKTTVVLKFTGKATQTQSIKFEKPFYKGEVDVASEQIIIPDIIKITEGEVADVKIIDTEYNEYFQATLSPDKKSVTIKLVNGLPPKVESSIVLVIEAFNVKNEVGRTTLVLDISDEETPITFTQLFYKGNVNKDKEEINLDAEIKIEKGDVESVSIVDGAFKEFFKATFSDETKIVTIEFEKTLPSTVESSIILVIEASNKQHQVGRTTVVLEVPDGTVQETPITFTQLIYKGNLNKDQEEINLDTEIKIEKGDVESVSIVDGEYKEFFKATFSDEKKIVTIEFEKTLPSTVESSIVLVIEASNKQHQVGRTTVVLEVPDGTVQETPITFTQLFYKGNVNNDKEEINLDAEIKIEKGDVESVSIVDGEYKEFFKTTFSDETKIVTIEFEKTLPSTVESSIVLVIEASNKQHQVGRTTVVLEVPDGTVQETPITFTQLIYKGNLNKDQEEINLDTEIKIEKGDVESVSIVDGEYKEFFKATFSDEKNIVTIEFEKTLPSTVESSIVLVIEASNKQHQVGRTTVVLEVPDGTVAETPITFTQLIYKGNLNKDQEEINLDTEIKIEKGDVESVSIVDGEYKEFFKATFSVETKIVTIEFEKKLPSTVESSIVLVIEASNKQHQVGRTTVVLEVPDGTVEETPITFTQLIYKGNLNKDKEEVNLDTEIKIEKGDVETVSIVDGEYKEFFKATFSVETNIVTIEFEKKLPSTVESSIVLVIEASNKQHQVGRTTVVLEVPDGTVEETPITFTQLFYKGNLNKDKEEINLDTEIKIEKGDVESVSIVDGEYNEFFKATLTDNNKVVTIELVKELPQITKSYIDLEIEVSNDKKQVGKTVVILEVENNLPVDDLINFTEPLYKGELNVITNEITVDTIKIDTGAVEIIKILGDYENLFKVDYDKNTKIVTLTVSGNLETINEPSVVFTLAAYNAKNEIGGQTTVVLTIVGDVIKPSPPTFEKTYYEGEFKVEGQSLNIEDIRIIKGDIESVIVVGNDYNTYFEAKYNEDTKLVEIIKLQELENILDSNIVFSLEASDKYGQSADATVVLKVLGKAEPEQDRIVFDEHEVGFILEEAEQLPKQLNPFVAKSTNNKDKITYRFIDSVPDGLKLDENTGVVSIVKILDKRVLSVKLGASGSDSGKSAETKFVIYSYQLQGNGEKATYSYIAKKVKEGEETATTILQHQNTDYKYCLLESNPNDEKITINEDGYLVSNELDREDHAFVDMIVPQYLVTVDLVKKSENCEKAKTSRMQKEIVEHINMYDQIENWESRTVVTVLIEDENDHDPIFEPSKQIIAYPEEEIAKIIRPMYLTKVHATDLDSKDNFGKITYSSESDYVVVNEDSGIIYPTDKIFSSDDFDFTVIATDGGGKTAELEVEVSLIDKDKISIMSFENIDLENVVDKLKELSEQSGINLQALSISAVPSEKSMLFKDYNYYTQAYVYGVKDNKIVSSNTIKENFNDVTVIEFNPNTSDGCDAEIEECDNTGLIAGVAVLAVLLAVVLAGSIAFYVLKLRKHNSASNDFNHHNDVERIIEKNAVREQPNNRRSTGFVFNSPPPEDDDVDLNPNNNEKIGDDFDRNLERRKSVSFNDQIETIKIDKTVPAEETEDSDAKKE